MNPGDNKFETKVTLEAGGSVLPDDAPFHVLFFGDWSGQAERVEISKRRPIVIDRDNFDDVLRKIRPTAVLDFEGSPSLSIEFLELDDFHPDNLFGRLTVFENLRAIRRRLKNADTFNEAAVEVRSWFPSSSANDEPVNKVVTSENLLDDILSGNTSDSVKVRNNVTESAELSAFIGNIVKSHIVETDLEEQANLLAAVDDVISDVMRKVLHHKAFQALESAWRGLYFLVGRTDTDTDLKIYLFDATKDELAADLKGVGSLTDSFYHRWTAGDTLETVIGEPWAVVCGNYAFEPNVDDVAALMRISQIGAVSNTSFVSHMRPEVIGISSFVESPNSSDWKIDEKSVEGRLWSALRDKKESEYLGMAMPRFMARLPYGRSTDPTVTFVFEEITTGFGHDDYLWFNPSFACAYLLAKSFRQNGWETAERLIRDVEGLPVHAYKVDGETFVKPCAEIPMTEAGVQVLVDCGVMPLISFRDGDRIRVGSFQSVSLTGERIRGRWY